LQIRELGAVGSHELGEPARITAVELHDAAAQQATQNQPEVRRTHRQHGQQRQAGPEVDRRQAGLRGMLRAGALERVRLALARPPFVLPGQLRCPHLVQQRHQLPHEDALVNVLGAVHARRRRALETPALEQALIHLELPGAPAHPLVDLAETAEVLVVKRGVRVTDRVRRAEPACRGPADELLPEHADPHRHRVDLGAERALVRQEVQEVPEQTGKARRRLQDLDRVGLPDR